MTQEKKKMMTVLKPKKLLKNKRNQTKRFQNQIKKSLRMKGNISVRILKLESSQDNILKYLQLLNQNIPLQKKRTFQTSGPFFNFI